MKKMLFFAGIAAAALLASCTKETAPEEGLDGSSAVSAIALNLKVSGLNDETRALKTGWSAGDVIDIWFDSNSQKVPDLVAKYDGSVWTADGSATVSGNSPAASGTLTAVYFSAGNQADYGWDSADVTTPVSGGKVVSDLVAYSQKMSYTYAESTVTATLDSWKYLANTQVVLAGSDLSEGNWAMKCDKLKAATGFTLSDGGVTPAYSDAGTFVLGQPNADGLAFYFLADSDASQDYEFAIYDLTGDRKYYYTATGKTLTSAVTARKAVKIAQSKFGVDYYRNFLDGKDLVIDSKTLNMTNYPSYTLVSSDITVAKLQTLLNTYGLIFINNGVKITQEETGTTTLILKKETALVGRIDNGVQPEISLGAYNFNTVYDLILKNVCLISSVATGPIQNASMTVNRSVFVEDCTISCLNYVVLDRAAGADYANLYFNNNIISYSNTTAAGFFYTYPYLKTTDCDGYSDYTFTNNVFYFNGLEGKGLMNLFRLNSFASDKTSYLGMRNLVLRMSHNTLYNICTSYLISVGSCKQIIFDDNVWESALSNGTSANLFQIKNPKSAIVPIPESSTVSNNYVYASNYDGATYPRYFGTPDGTYFTVTDWRNTRQGQSGAGTLLGEIDADRFYFPVNPSKVGTAGASYDTKKWVLRDWSE